VSIGRFGTTIWVDLTPRVEHLGMAAICAQKTAGVDVQRSLETAFVNVLGGRIPSLQWGRERQDSAQKQTYANIADSSIASAISGISGVGEKPSSAGARTA
jgi:hypothetical protein